MISINYRNAYKEVYMILNCLSDEEYQKIPPYVIRAIKTNMNNDYHFEFQSDIDLRKQKILPETKATLFNIFRDYLSTPVQRSKIIKMQNESRRKVEREKEKIYSDIFWVDSSVIHYENKSLVNVKEKNILQKLIEKIKERFFQ